MSEPELVPYEEEHLCDCDACQEEVPEDSLVHLDSGKMSDLLKEVHIYSICQRCHAAAKILYKSDIEIFDNWLREHDNRDPGLEISEGRRLLRRGYNLSTTLLGEDPDEYLQQIDKYASNIEDMLIWITDRYNLDIGEMIQEFKKHKVKML